MPLGAQELDELYELCQAAWPTLTLPKDAFAAHLGRGAEPVNREHVAELFLSCACLAGDPKAISLFERNYLSQIPLFLSKVERDPDAVADVQQSLREKLLVAPAGGVARLAEYTGSGSLGGWLRVVAVRAALDRKRAHKSTVSSDSVPEAVLSPSVDPELDFIRHRYASEFREAFAAAILSLDPKNRTILRLHIVDGLNIEKIGLIYDVHRATVARWIADIRSTLFNKTRDELARRLSLSTNDFDSVVRLVGNDLDASVHRLLTESTSQGT